MSTAQLAAAANAANAATPDLSQSVAEMCLRVPVSAGPAALTAELAKLAPRLAFRAVLERGGWYRLGGVVDAAGSHLADDIEAWAEHALAEHGDDFQALFDDYADSGLRATRLSGRTHYLVAAYGPGAADFIQIEIEELQEMLCHPLFEDDEVPANLEGLIDPRAACTSLTPIGTPFYKLRCVTDAAAFLERMRAQKPEPQPIHRFMAAWEASSAGQASQFVNHWILAVREHLDRYRQAILHAKPVAAINGLPPRFDIVYGARGLTLHQGLQRFDRAAGYPMAWFFHMLTSKAVPHAVATTVLEDVQGGFHYLPDRDVQVVRDWVHRPFAL